MEHTPRGEFTLHAPLVSPDLVLANFGRALLALHAVLADLSSTPVLVLAFAFLRSLVPRKVCKRHKTFALRASHFCETFARKVCFCSCRKFARPVCARTAEVTFMLV